MRIWADDPVAFAQLFRDRYARIWAFAYDLTGSVDHADEVVQDVFASIWAHRVDWVVTHSVAEYLFGAVRSHTYKMCRHLAPFDRAETTGANNDICNTDICNVICDASRDAGIDIIRDAIRALPPTRRVTLLLRWYDGLSPLEIASVTGVSVKAVHFQLLCIRDDLSAVVQIPESLDACSGIPEFNQAVTAAALYESPESVESAYDRLMARIARDELAANAAAEALQADIEKQLFRTTVSFGDLPEPIEECSQPPRSFLTRIRDFFSQSLAPSRSQPQKSK